MLEEGVKPRLADAVSPEEKVKDKNVL